MLIVFLSTGRCGTQFCARYLAAAGAERAVVVHEPLGGRYASRVAMRHPDLGRMLESNPEIATHFAGVERTLAAGHAHIETGWPNFAWVPWLLDRYGERCVVVHLTRDPMRFAFSLASHDYHAPERRDDEFTQQAQLLPTDAGVRHRAYANVWTSLNAVEKSLFQWLEINTFAEELKREHGRNFVSVRSEDVLDRPAALLEQLWAHDGRLRQALHDASFPNEIIDSWHAKIGVDIETVRSLPAVAELARLYGYSMHVDEQSIAMRFFD